MNIYHHRVITLDIPGFWKNIIRISIVPVSLCTIGWFVINHFLAEDSLVVFLAGVIVYSVLFWVLNWFVSMNSYEKQLVRGMMKR
jgi:hypothetical protein